MIAFLLFTHAVSRLRHLVRESEDDELSRANSSHTDLDDHATFKNIQRRHRFAKPHCDVERMLGLNTLEGALPPQPCQKVLDHGLHAYPGVCVIWLKDKLTGGFFDRFLHEAKESTD